MKKILFLIHDLGQGGAEKVLVNLVNHMDAEKFDISVTAMFGGGVNEQFLSPSVRYRAVFPRSIPGNSRLMKLLTPAQLYRLCVGEKYDIVVSYLEGPSARAVSGCPCGDTRLLSWIHGEQRDMAQVAAPFRSEEEARRCYNRFDRLICVSRTVAENFTAIVHPTPPVEVLYNTVESDRISALAGEPLTELQFPPDVLRLVAVGTLKPVKGFDRLLRIHRRLLDAGLKVHTCILGRGPEEDNLRRQIAALGVETSVTLAGYHTNPYKFLANADLFVCTSHAEGFSTAATEALIVGTPVCTTRVSGMEEMLGASNEYGIVTDNDEEAQYQQLYALLSRPEMLAEYKARAARRGRHFNTSATVRAVEEMLEKL